MKKILSYIWPVRKKVDSSINGTLEVSWVNGKKILDSKNANYSYGALQRVLTFGLSVINIASVSNILLLGLGGGCVVQTLKEKFRYPGKITIVEIDPVVIDLAEREFGIANSRDVEIVCDDAFKYINHCAASFGLIIIDLFIDDKVPAFCYSADFWNKIAQLTKTSGYVIFNAGMNSENHDRTDEIVNDLKNRFDFIKYEGVEDINTLLTGKKVEK